MLDAIPAETLLGKPDRALLVPGMADAIRRSEPVTLEMADLERLPEGLRATTGRSGTDREEGAGEVIAILRGSRLRPVRAVLDWKPAAITGGPVFRAINRHDQVLPAG